MNMIFVNLKGGIMKTMGTDKPIENIKLQDEIYTCPACGYKDGFHVSFKMNPGEKTYHIVLICPSCHKRFNTGWTASM